MFEVLIFNEIGRPKRLFVFVNPFGGEKSATNVFHDQVKPLLEDAQVQLTVQGFVFLNNCFIIIIIMILIWMHDLYKEFYTHL